MKIKNYYIKFLLIFFFLWIIIIFFILLKLNYIEENLSEDSINNNLSFHSFINNSLSSIKKNQNTKKNLNSNQSLSISSFHSLLNNSSISSNSSLIINNNYHLKNQSYKYYNNIYHFWNYDPNLLSLNSLNSFESFLFSYPNSNHIIILTSNLIFDEYSMNDSNNTMKDSIQNEKFQENFTKYILLGYNINFYIIKSSLFFILNNNNLYEKKYFRFHNKTKKCYINNNNNNEEEIEEETFNYLNEFNKKKNHFSLSSLSFLNSLNLYTFNDSIIPFHIQIYLKISLLYLYGGIANDLQYIMYDEKNHLNEVLRKKSYVNENYFNLTNNIIENGYHYSYICYNTNNSNVFNSNNSYPSFSPSNSLNPIKSQYIKNLCSTTSLIFSYKPYDPVLFCVLSKFNEIGYLRCVNNGSIFSNIKCIKNIFSQCYNINNRKNQISSIDSLEDPSLNNFTDISSSTDDQENIYFIEESKFEILNIYSNLFLSENYNSIKLLDLSSNMISIPTLYNTRKKKKVNIVLLGPIVKKNFYLNNIIEKNDLNNFNLFSNLTDFLKKKIQFNFINQNKLNMSSFTNSKNYSFISSISVNSLNITNFDFSNENINQLPLQPTNFSSLITSNLLETYDKTQTINYFMNVSSINNSSDLLFPSAFSFLSNFDSTFSFVISASLIQSFPFFISSSSLKSISNRNFQNTSILNTPHMSYTLPITNITTLYPNLNSHDPFLFLDQNLINFSYFNIFMPSLIYYGQKNKNVVFILRDPFDYIYNNYLNYLNHNYDNFFPLESSSFISHKKSRAKIYQDNSKTKPIENKSSLNYSFDYIIYKIISDQYSGPSILRTMIINGTSSNCFINFYFEEIRKYEENVKKYNLESEELEKNDDLEKKYSIKKTLINNKLHNYMTYLLISSFYFPLIVHYNQNMGNSSVKIINYDSYDNKDKFMNVLDDIYKYYNLKQYYSTNNIEDYSKIKIKFKNNLLMNFNKLHTNEKNLFNNLLNIDEKGFVLPSKNIYYNLVNFYSPSIKLLENYNNFLILKNDSLTLRSTPHILDTSHRLRGSQVLSNTPTSFPLYLDIINNDKLIIDIKKLSSFNLTLWHNLKLKENIINNIENDFDTVLDLTDSYYSIMSNITFVPGTNHTYSELLWYEKGYNDFLKSNSSIFNIIPLLISSKTNNENNSNENQYNSTLGMYNTF